VNYHRWHRLSWTGYLLAASAAFAWWHDQRIWWAALYTAGYLLGEVARRRARRFRPEGD
jgi:phosphatidylglycerophosphate synthase